MSPNLESRWTTWGTVSSGFREIKLRGDRLESVGLLAPFLAPATVGLGTAGRRRLDGSSYVPAAIGFPFDPVSSHAPSSLAPEPTLTTGTLIMRVRDQGGEGVPHADRAGAMLRTQKPQSLPQRKPPGMGALGQPDFVW